MYGQLPSPLIVRMADAVLDYVQAAPPRHARDISAYLAREFENAITGELHDREFKRVMAKAKDRGHHREPPIAFLPVREGKSFVGFWTTTPEEDDALAHAELQIKQVAARAARDSRSYLIATRGMPELEASRKIIRTVYLVCEPFLDDELGTKRSEHYRNARMAELVRLVAHLDEASEVEAA